MSEIVAANASLTEMSQKRFIQADINLKSRPAISVGYCHDKKAYRLYDPTKGEFFASRDFKFIEEQRGSTLLDAGSYIPERLDDLRYDSQRLSAMTEEQGTVAVPIIGETASAEHVDTSQDPADIEDSVDRHDDHTSEGDQTTDTDEASPSPPLRRSARLSRPPNRLQVDPRKVTYCEMLTDEQTDPQSYDEAIPSKNSSWKCSDNSSWIIGLVPAWNMTGSSLETGWFRPGI
ncbi:uncharacterized protein LOC135398647 [Ornithodoros turicata]|uniref:uncharacterized protein LOC135398647 n=1 Tax=Ornithodoros turicata TaxID=34597 RepID=UPI00313A41EE